LDIVDSGFRVGTNVRLSNVTVNIHRIFELTGTTSVLNIDTT